MLVEQSLDSASKRRQRQMLRHHLCTRRGSIAGCGDRSRHLQTNLYKFLGERQSSEIGCSRGDERCESSKKNADEPHRRDVLLKAINSLQRLTLSPATGIVSGSNANGCAAPHEPVAESAQLTEQAQQLYDNLRYLALACNPTVSGARAGVSSCAGVELTKRIATARHKVDRLLRQLSIIGGNCCKGDSKPVAPCPDPLFWRFPDCEAESGKPPQLQHQCSQRQKQQKEQQRLRRRQRRQADPVAQLVARSKSALIGDPVFQVNCIGQEHRWGRMTLPTVSSGPNAADRLGRENLHRQRMIKHREAIRAEVGDFANKLEEKWEAIEEARMDMAIDAACRRLRLALRQRPKRKSKRQALHAEPSMPTSQCDSEFVPQSNQLPTMMDVARGTSHCHQSDDRSIEWGV